MKEADYATSKEQRVERILSLSLALVWVALAGVFGGPGAAIRLIASLIIVLACIWFPDVMSRFRGPALGRDYAVTEPSHPTVIRWAAWGMLTIVPVVVIAFILMRP